ncbi:hypothetical protein O181_105555 [Austropuccinia psidii MF-1]|uniref:Uncharacterized protein n=1 Tax=Austropuccinia psidii MF-1 TaxID=1389203 RepID=A0A9Q3JQQ3_9BASI|nr:hypothetical protein [Austropuccinia psidii MF-1]
MTLVDISQKKSERMNKENDFPELLLRRDPLREFALKYVIVNPDEIEKTTLKPVSSFDSLQASVAGRSSKKIGMQVCPQKLQGCGVPQLTKQHELKFNFGAKVTKESKSLSGNGSNSCDSFDISVSFTERTFHVSDIGSQLFRRAGYNEVTPD